MCGNDHHRECDIVPGVLLRVITFGVPPTRFTAEKVGIILSEIKRDEVNRLNLATVLIDERVCHLIPHYNADDSDVILVDILCEGNQS